MKLSNPQITLGNGVPDGSVLTTNTESAADGRASILVDSLNSFQKAAGRQVITITFDVAQNAPTGDTEVTFTDGSISDAQANGLAANYTSGKITINGPNAVGVTVSGRVVTPEGAGLRNATVKMTDS